jgi:sarcosine oxidase subunit gamma
MSDVHKEGALARHTAKTDAKSLAIGISVVEDRGMIDLRGLAGDKAFMQAASKATGIDLPKEPHTSATKGDIAVLWLSVDQWLITCPADKTAKLLKALRKGLEGIHSLAVDMSDARTIIRLEGDGVREVLMKGAPVDLLSSEVKPGTVRRLRFGEIAAMVHVAGEAPDVIDLYVFRSYADFAWDWLVKTAAKPAAIRLFGSQEAPAV